MELRKEFVRDIRNHQYEVSEQGLFLPRHKVVVGGIFTHDVLRGGELLGEESDHNLMVDEGLNHILDVIYHGVAQVSPWYIGLFKGNYTPVAGDTAATIATNATEATEYDEATRVAYNEAAAAAKSITNSANRATLTINGTVTIYGAFLVSTSVKGGNTGVLSAASRFAAQRNLVANDQLLVTYTIAAADA